MDDPAHVRAQYADESNLETRRSVWRPGPSGVDPLDLVVEAVRAAVPKDRAMPDVLEVGCGPGVFAARLVEELPGIALLATDQSQRFVELTRERGVPAQLQDVQHLLAPDDSYDVAIAMWMLYHVPDLDRGLAELRRVLRPGGRFIAVTNGDEHVADAPARGGWRRRTHHLQQRERRGRPAPALRLGHPAGRRDPRGLRRPGLRARLPGVVRGGRRLVAPRGRLAARVRRPPDGACCELAGPTQWERRERSDPVLASEARAPRDRLGGHDGPRSSAQRSKPSVVGAGPSSRG